MQYFNIGISIAFGILFGYSIISTIYFLFHPEINKFCSNTKTKLKNRRKEPKEPTVCEKLGDVKIFPKHYEIVQAKKRHFNREKKNAHTLIEFIFPAPQITHNKFYNDVIRLNNAFEKQYNSLHLYFRAYPKEDEISREVIGKGIDNLTDFNNKLEDLIKQLSQLVVCNKPTDNLMKDMEEEVESVKNYENVI